MTWNLGTVMKESTTIALEYIKANAKQGFEILSKHSCTFQKALHKDGPSAGIAMLTSLVSLFTQNG
jgi:ATP-dependent Lon protease